MFYFLSKILPLFAYPAGLAATLLTLGLLFRRNQRWLAAFSGLALLTILLGGNRLVAITLVRNLEGRHAPLTEPQHAAADVLVVLGGGARQGLPPRPSHEVGEAGDRLIYAARLYREGVASRILVSGGHAPLSNAGTMPEADTMADLLVFFGVPRDAIAIEGSSKNTYENGVDTAKLLAAQDIHRIILVTSAMHMPRAYAVFNKLGLEVVPAPTDYMVTESDWAYYTRPNVGIQLLNLLPKAEYMELTEKAMKEILGIWVYSLRGWL